MLNCVSTADKLQVVTSGAITSDVHASYVDLTTATGAVTPGRKNTAISTAATTDVVVAPASGDIRNLKSLHVRNTHASSSNTYTVQHTDGTTVATLLKATLLPGESLEYVEGQGFRLYDSSGQVKVGAIDVNPSQNDFRLSGVSATPVMTADSTTLGTVYLASWKGNNLALYDGSNWQLLSPPSEVSLAVTGRTTDLPFDVFAFSNAGTVTLEFLDWTSATARATGLTRLNGVWTKTGDSTRRYLGSIRARSATTFHWVTVGTDLPVKFDLWNMDNRIDFNFCLKASTATWAYTTATVRQAQASTNYQVDIMVGLQESYFEGLLEANSTNSTISIGRSVGIGFDSTTTIHAQCVNASVINTVASIMSRQIARLAHQPTIGRHFYAWLETSVATGTATWTGASAGAGFNLQSGMVGSWTC